MKLFSIHCIDRPNALDLRMANRPAHLDWAKSHLDRIAVGGPLLAADGETFVGSMFLIACETLEDAKAWAANDPYAKAGLFERVEIRPYRWLLGDGKLDSVTD